MPKSKLISTFSTLKCHFSSLGHLGILLLGNGNPYLALHRESTYLTHGQFSLG